MGLHYLYLKQLTTVAEPTFIKLALARQSFVKKFCAEFRENPTNGLVAYIRSQTELSGQADEWTDLVYTSGAFDFVNKA